MTESMLSPEELLHHQQPYSETYRWLQPYLVRTPESHHASEGVSTAAEHRFYLNFANKFGSLISYSYLCCLKLN